MREATFKAFSAVQNFKFCFSVFPAQFVAEISYFFKNLIQLTAAHWPTAQGGYAEFAADVPAEGWNLLGKCNVSESPKLQLNCSVLVIFPIPKTTMKNCSVFAYL